MKITRFTQSCMLIEIGTTRILIDPGNDFGQAHDIKEVGKITAVLYTHEHADHFDPDLYSALKDMDVSCFANESLGSLADGFELVNDGQDFTINDVRIKAYDLEHCLLPDGSSGPQNTGYLLDGRFFHPGDGINLENLEVEILALPITGPDISMLDAFRFANRLNAKQVIPIHYDKIGAKPEVYASFSERFNEPYEFAVLADGETTEL